MFITKFNKLIQSKLLWGTFLVIIVLAFVGWGMRSPNTREGPPPPGKLNGEPVPLQEFLDARFHTYLAFTLMTARLGMPLDVTDEIAREIRAQAWKRVVSLRTARAMGLGTSDKEIARILQREPLFRVNGEFSEERYFNYIRNMQTRVRMSVLEFEEHLRQETTLTRLRDVTAGAAAWVAPAETQWLAKRFSTEFVVQYVSLAATNFASETPLADAELAAYFEEHKEEFGLPERVAVRYVAFPHADFTPEQAPDTNAVDEYYNEHLETYTTLDTNDNPVAQPLNEVREDIVALLTAMAQADMAVNKATDFVIQLAPNRDGSAPAFEALATEFALTVHTTRFFAAEEPLTNLNVGAGFNRDAFALDPDPDKYFSDAVEEEQNTFVLALQEKKDARIPALHEVQEEAAAATRRSRAREAMRAKAESLRDTLLEKIQAGNTFEDACRTLGLDVVTTDPFTAYEGPASDPYAREIMDSIAAFNTGEIADVRDLGKHALIVFVLTAVPMEEPDPTLRKQIMQELGWRRSELLFAGYQSFILEQAHFEEPPPPEPVQEEEEEEEEEEE